MVRQVQVARAVLVVVLERLVLLARVDLPVPAARAVRKGAASTVSGPSGPSGPGGPTGPGGLTQIINANTTLYIATTGNDTTGDGSNGNPWATIAKALSYLGNYWIPSTVTVAICVKDGTYSQSSTIVPTHPCGSQIQIVGQNYYAKSITSVQSTSGSAGAYSIVVNINSVANIAVNDYITIQEATGGTYPRMMVGVHKITNVDAGNSRITFLSCNRSTLLPSGAVTASVNILKTIISCTTCHGIQVNANKLGWVNTIVFVGDGTAGYMGYYAMGGGSITFGNLACASHFSDGFYCEFGGSLIAGNTYSSGNTNLGYGAVGGVLNIATITASGNAGTGVYIDEYGFGYCSFSSKSVGNGGSGYAINGPGMLSGYLSMAYGNVGHGWQANGGGYIYAPNSYSTYNNGWGYVANTGGVIQCGSASSTNNNGWGYYADTYGIVQTGGATGGSNSAGDFYPPADQQGATWGFNSSTGLFIDTRPPVGSVIAWLKSYTNTPALPTGWVECDGQTLSDAGSVYNGQVIPNLNASGGGAQRFLRGATASGGTGGEDTHALSVAELAAHSHTFNVYGVTNAGSYQAGAVLPNTLLASPSTSTVGSGTAHENRPPYYEVVWIMRVK